MKELISEVVTKLIEQAERSGCELSLKSLGSEGFLLTNKPNGKVAAVGIVNIKNDGKKEKIIGAFTINVNKYQWAEAEGFSQKQMIEQLNDQIFELIGIDEVPDYLCN